MIRFSTAKEKNTIQVAVTGHARSTVLGSLPGGATFDIVCGMVSVLTQAALFGCFNFGKDTYVIAVEPGRVIFVTRRTPISEALIDSMAEGIKETREQFPECFEDGGDE